MGSNEKIFVEKTVCGHCEHIKEHIDGFYCPIISKNVSFTGKTCPDFKWRFKNG